MREEILRVLTEHGVTGIDGSIHDWRCRYPERYDYPCTHVDALVDDLVKAVKS